MQQNVLNVNPAYGSNSLEVLAFVTRFFNMFNMPMVRLKLFAWIVNVQLSIPIVLNAN